MELIPFNSREHKASFERYIKEWQVTHSHPRDQHYYSKIYLDALNDYDSSLTSFVAESEEEFLEQGKIWCQYYWWIEEGDILGTLRYRLNDKEIYDQVGYDVSPRARNRGVASRMLASFLRQVPGKLSEVFFTVPVNNAASEKVLLANGAKYVNRLYFEAEDEYLKQYVIELD